MGEPPAPLPAVKISARLNPRERRLPHLHAYEQATRDYAGSFYEEVVARMTFEMDTKDDLFGSALPSPWGAYMRRQWGVTPVRFDKRPSNAHTIRESLVHAGISPGISAAARASLRMLRVWSPVETRA